MENFENIYFWAMQIFSSGEPMQFPNRTMLQKTSLLGNAPQLMQIVYRPRIILQKVEGFFSLPLDGGGLGWG
ncbi:MAG: hypothetical protein KKD99_01890 [Proteobacteria bacterium]|nr:hypothetical protein [Pseudomonadota bacterium]